MGKLTVGMGLGAVATLGVLASILGLLYFRMVRWAAEEIEKDKDGMIVHPIFDAVVDASQAYLKEQGKLNGKMLDTYYQWQDMKREKGIK